MSESSDLHLAEKLRQHEEAFSVGGNEGESDESLANDLVKFILERRRILADVPDGSKAAGMVDKQTLKLMQEWDSDNPAMSTLEKVLRRLATGRGVAAVELLKSAVTLRAEALSRDQSRKAKAPRKQHLVDELIEHEVIRNPNISEKELLRKLHGRVGWGVIESIESDEIITNDYPASPILKVSGLKDRLTRVKKRVFAKAG